jgi:hypothetical protein
MAICPHCNKEFLESKESAAIIADHYQKTFDLTYNLWQERNKNFIMLLIISAAEILIAYRTEQVTGVLAAIYKALTDLSLDEATNAINNGFPFNILQTILLAVILFLMIQIYHRTSHINRSYGYLGALETDIRERLKSHVGETSFTREGDYYKNNRPKLLKLTGLVYAIFLGFLLVLVYFGGYWIESTKNTSKTLIDYIILVTIALYYFSYLYLIIEPGIAKPKQELGIWWKSVKEEKNLLSKMLLSSLIPGSIFGIIALLPIYFFANGFTWPQFGIKQLLLALAKIVIFSILFGVISSTWPLIRKARVKKTEVKTPPRENSEAS